MENKLNKIRKALNKDFFAEYVSDWKQVELTENDILAKCKSVLLNESKVKNLIISLDKHGNKIHPLLSSEKGINDLKIQNDYLIFALYDSKIYTLLIELKSSNSTGWIKQCKAGEIIAKYIIQMVNNWTKDIVLEIDNFNFRYILFHTKDTIKDINKNKRKNKSKKKTKALPFEYKVDKEGFLFTRKSCNEEYNLKMFCK